jgi:membrane-anchored mycosin MYCP
VSLDPAGEGLIDRLAADGTPISGTSYAAPIVSGIVALLRSRSPELTARQVMQRIEETAHRPSAGWDPVVGHGTVDGVAAVSAGPSPSDPEEHLPQPLSISVPERPDARPTQIAVRGAAICIAVSVAVMAMTASANRLRRRTDAVPPH